MSIFKSFDAYNRKARVYPALIATLPILALLFVLVPWDHIGLPHAIAGTMSVVLLFALADVARRSGRKVEAKLGSRDTPEQWHRGNADIAEGAKDRYRRFLAEQLELPAPTVDDERLDPARANDFYMSAGNWIREHTRDTRTFAILFGENVTYGFRRNLLGLKPIALTFNAVVFGICISILHFRPSYSASLAHIDEKIFIIMAAVVLHSAYMLFAVGKAAVWEASRTYGRQMILSCETLMGKASSQTRPQKPKPVGSSKTKGV